jgi:hypothetical protein
MVDQPPIRQITIKISKPEPPTEPDREYIIHWDRIIGAFSALIVLIGLLGYGLYAWLKPSIPPASNEVEARQSQDEIRDGTAQQTDGAVKKAVPLPSEPERSTSEASQQMGTESRAPRIGAIDRGSVAGRSSLPPDPLSEVPPAQVVSQATAGAAHRPAESTPLPAKLGGHTDVKIPVSDEIAGSTKMQSPVREDPPISVTAQTPVLESGGEEQRVVEQKGPSEAQPSSSASAAPDTPVAVGAKTVLQTESDKTATASEIAEEKIDKGRLQLPKTTIASPAVKRFLLAQSVINNEPYGVLDDISVNSAGFAVISSFSEVIGLEGEVLQYRWLHEGEEVLRIRVPVRANRWRSHSTKRIYAAMKGTWRAELRDSEGTLLASTEFVF